MKTKAFIFDLDGVIVDTAKYHYLAWKKLANNLNIDFTHEHNELLKGVSRVRSLEIILGLGNVEASDEQKNEWLIQKNKEYLEYIDKMDDSEILPGVMDVLNFLKENNQPIILGSASKNARPILEKVNILNYFDDIVDGNDVSNAKPDPEVFIVGAKKANQTNENSIVFEDSVAGIEAANVAGMTSIGIGEASVLNEAKYNFKNFTEISEDFLVELINQ
ncbi:MULTISPECIES: beta-phosphoglucomutase [Empedobacter]|uniref:beta-phosphoglucomutase n=1 Tax=Empedobacter TaxID=59734 RepID=UPI000E8D0E43|nr:MULTISPECIES: beta-phosphoglucomutase [Empedobacter]MBY0065519.1 beta-phosphoglucomutase [Empedobacter falsenii]MDH0659885.1 beta-phosphoglucomutase [Empedobacter sp. GD03865]MDM1137940.1 beta-phosphoglucomutase [Empedobacter sp. R132-2]HBX63267.1 beta-phosphoglucomutase [Flavobacteriaceae bacterium]